MDFTTPGKPAIYGMAGLPRLNARFVAGDVALCHRTLQGMLAVTGGSLSVDIETFGLGELAHKIKCVQFGTSTGAVILDPRDARQHQLVRETIAQAREIVFHNSAFDVPNLHVNGLLTIDDCAKVTDTVIWARLAQPLSTVTKSLGPLAIREYGYEELVTMEEIFKRMSLNKEAGYATLDIDSFVYLAGAASDAIVTARLRDLTYEAALKHTTSGHPFAKYGVTGDEAVRLMWREQRLNRMTLRNACRGILVDMDFMAAYKAEYGPIREAKAAELEAFGISPGDGNSLMAFLDSIGAVPKSYPRTEKTKQLSSAKGDLETLKHPVAELFIEQKQLTKIEFDYLDKVERLAKLDGRCRPTVNYLAASTGRQSVGSPPLQQFNAPSRGILRADPGTTWTSIDYSQIEPVIASNHAKEYGALVEFDAGTDDFYGPLIRKLGREKKVVKRSYLACLYGQGISSLSDQLGITADEAHEVRDLIFGAMPELAKMNARMRDIGDKYKKMFTVSGRITVIEEGFDKKTKKRYVKGYTAMNRHVQGSGWDLMAEALIMTEEAGLGDAVKLTIHDEIICDTEAAHDIQKFMETPPERLIMMSGRVPIIRTDANFLGTNWKYC